MARRAPRVVWLPPTTENSVGQPAAGLEVTWKRFVIDITGPIGTTSTGEVPVVIDGADQANNAFASISDLYNSTYRLRRIVGKIFFSARPNGLESVASPRVLGVTAGFIIRSINPASGQSLAGLTLDQSATSPALITNSNDPWIWRRSWIIGRLAELDSPQTTDAFPSLPNTNFGNNGASAVDSGHFDQKTARIVGPEERLFLDVSVTILTQDAEGALHPDSVTFVDCVYEARVLASIKSGSGNRRNASR